MDTQALLDHMRTSFLTGALVADRFTDDVVVEWPFAAAGRPRRIEGRDEFVALAGPARAALPFRLDRFEVDEVHEAGDAVIVEYRLGGLIAGERREAPFVAVIRLRDGRIAAWREYQNAQAMAAIDA